MDGMLYVRGESLKDGVVVMHRFDPLLKKWEDLGSLRENMNDSCVAALDGKFYVAGGISPFRSSVSAAVDVYDPSGRAWTAAAAMTRARVSASAAVVCGKFYMAGG